MAVFREPQFRCWIPSAPTTVQQGEISIARPICRNNFRDPTMQLRTPRRSQIVELLERQYLHIDLERTIQIYPSV